MENQENKKISTPKLHQKHKHSSSSEDFTPVRPEPLTANIVELEPKWRERANTELAEDLGEYQDIVEGADILLDIFAEIEELKEAELEEAEANKPRIKKQWTRKNWAATLEERHTKVAGWDDQTIEWREDWLKNNPDKSKKVKNRWYTTQRMEKMKVDDPERYKKMLADSNLRTKKRRKKIQVDDPERYKEMLADSNLRAKDWKENLKVNNPERYKEIIADGNLKAKEKRDKLKLEKPKLQKEIDSDWESPTPNKHKKIREEGEERVMPTFAPLVPALFVEELNEAPDILPSLAPIAPSFEIARPMPLPAKRADECREVIEGAKILPGMFTKNELKKKSPGEKIGMFK